MNLHEINLHLAIELARASDRKGLYDGLSCEHIVRLISTLNRYSRAQHRMVEDHCNRPWGPREYARQKALHTRILKHCEINGLTTFSIHSDPRAGCGLTVTVNDRHFHLANSQGR